MDRPERNENDDAQKAKLIFISLAALVAILLIWSLYSGNTARKERDKAVQEAETLKQDNARMELLLKDQNTVIEDMKKKLSACEAKAKKPAPKKKAAPAKKASKKSRRN